VLSEDLGARRSWLEKAMDHHLTPEERKMLMEASEIMLLQLTASGYLRRITIRNPK